MTGSLTYYRSPPWRELFPGKLRAYQSPTPTLLSREKAPLGAMVSTNGGGSPCDPNIGRLIRKLRFSLAARKTSLRLFFFCFFCYFVRRPPRTWRSEVFQLWAVDVDHGNTPRSLWNIAVGDPIFWVTIVILANCATHVLLG